MPVTPSSTLFGKCSPLLRTDYDPCESLTQCNVSPTTPDEFASIYQDGSSRWRHMGALIEANIEGSMCGIREYTLADFLLANSVQVDAPITRKIQGGGYPETEPFVVVRRKNIINSTYWKYTNSSSTPGTAPNNVAYTHFVDAVSISAIPAAANWFPDGIEIFISGLSTSGTAIRGSWLVVDAATTDANTTRVYLTSRNAATALPASKVSFPSQGLITRGIVNVSEYESFCDEIPALNPNANYLAWLETTRWSLCNDDINVEFRNRLVENNPLYREFFHVPEVERNRQVMTDFKKRLAHAFFWSKKLDANQTENLWKNLPTISSQTLSSFSDVSARCVGRRANMVGIYEQLYECGRVVDAQGQRLNFPELQRFLYDIKRVREDNGGDGSVIEIVVDSAYRVKFIQGLWRYLTATYEGALRANMDINNDKKTNLGFVFTDFALDYPAGTTLRVVSHKSFDDLLTAHRQVSSSIESAGRIALILDWSTVKLGVVSSETVTHRSASAEDIAKFNQAGFCVMKTPQKSVKLYSATITAIVDCPAANLWLENFEFAVPEHEQIVGTVDGVGNWTANDAG